MTIAEQNKDKLYEIAKSGNKVAVTVCGKIQTCRETPCNICIAGCVDESCGPVIRQYLSREAYCEFEQDELVEVSDNGTEWRIRHFADINAHSDEYSYHVYDAGFTSKDPRAQKVPYKYCRKYGTLGGLVKEQK